ncbi:DUF4112 domain-containing protein [Parvularcula sp. ZS-1/3]|uniref:DUF4112 domain-containing protein n=1 Tax=Parvularcula mediterranea TaxID=2732508 RepID=A0A7Y3RKB1_9PROT|nr:DUF4112 domain-containing protein [Parvularcula mediterranea]NNU15644.1 DUF4112 domain-containing protein [Parvularcula mediterranea]
MRQGILERSARPGVSGRTFRSSGRGRAEVVDPLPKEVERLDHIATLLDSRFSFLGIRFGFDSILGLVPVVGDAAALGISGYLIAEAARAGARKRTLLTMLMNTTLDAVIGSVPLLGDLFDVAFKANKRNVALVRRELLRKHERRRAKQPLTVDLH